MIHEIFSKKIIKMIKRAYEAADEATHYQKHGCIIFDKKIISKGSSEGIKTCPGLTGLVNKMHAEMSAIKRAESELIGATLIVVRGTFERPTMSRPCIHCLTQIKESGIKNNYL